MAGFGDILQKAVYLGIGLASYAGEKAGDTIADLRRQAQKLAEEMVTRGEMTAEEAKRFVDEMVGQAQATVDRVDQVEEPERPKQPRKIEILDPDETTTGSSTPSSTGKTDTQTSSQSAMSDVDALRQQMKALQDELNRLRNG